MSAYFDRPRPEILPHVPARLARVLDVGCGAGATVALLRERQSGLWVAGIEPDAAAAERARARCDRLWTEGLEAAPLEAVIPPASLDLVLCLDVLEHMVDPWAAVRRLSRLLAPGGRLIVSVPNVRHWKFLWRLAVRGDFHYTDAGLLDRTHLRFFTLETAGALACAGGLRLCHLASATPYRALDARRLMIRASGGRLEALIAKQALAVAEAPGDPSA